MKVLLCLVLISLTACTFREDKLGDDSSRIDSMRPWYTNLLETLIRPKCLECHTGSGGLGHLDLSTYDAIMFKVVKGKPLESRFYTSLNGVGGSMPDRKQPLSTREIKMIYDWIAANAPLDSTGESPEVPPEIPQPTFTWIDQHILKRDCVTCHSAHPEKVNPRDREPAGGIDLTEYEKFATNPTLIIPGDANASALYDAVKTGWMPLDGNPLSPEKVQAIHDWIENGALKD